MGSFDGYAVNRQPMLRVMAKHREAAYAIPSSTVQADLLAAARSTWDEAHELGARHGYRNGQISVIAPTGTISFMLDCDTTGVEPDIALVKYKKLVGGGMLKMVNNTVPAALKHLGYGEGEVAGIVAYIDANDTIEGAPKLRDDDGNDIALVVNLYDRNEWRWFGLLANPLSAHTGHSSNQDVLREMFRRSP